MSEELTLLPCPACKNTNVVNSMFQCTEQAKHIMTQHGINHTVIAVCVPANKHEPK
jgi:hypothetical protein